MIRRSTPANWPRTFCTANTCWSSIQISDHSPVPKPAPHSELAAALAASVDSDSPDVEIAEIAPDFRLQARLGWDPVYSSDPLRIIIQLSEAAYQQQTELFLAGVLATMPTNNLHPELTANWTDRLTWFNLVNADTWQPVLSGTNAWKPFLMTASNHLSFLDAQLPVRTCEFLVPGTNITLAPGRYRLSVAWNGDTSGDPFSVNGIAWAPDLVFTVINPISAVEQANHLGRMAWEADAHGRQEEAWSLGRQALALDGSAASPERSDTYALVAGIAFEKKDYGAAYDTVAAWNGITRTGSDIARLTRELGQSMAPRMRMLPPAIPGQPLRLRLSGWPDQRLVTEQSSDMSHWLPLSTNQVGVESWVEITAPDTNVPRQGYFRTKWVP
jgi:hypothetical protein